MAEKYKNVLVKWPKVGLCIYGVETLMVGLPAIHVYIYIIYVVEKHMYALG